MGAELVQTWPWNKKYSKTRASQFCFRKSYSCFTNASESIFICNFQRHEKSEKQISDEVQKKYYFLNTVSSSVGGKARSLWDSKLLKRTRTQNHMTAFQRVYKVSFHFRGRGDWTSDWGLWSPLPPDYAPDLFEESVKSYRHYHDYIHSCTWTYNKTFRAFFYSLCIQSLNHPGFTLPEQRSMLFVCHET